MSSLLPSLPPAPVIRPSADPQSDPCGDKAEQVKHGVKTSADLNRAERSFMQLALFFSDGAAGSQRPSPAFRVSRAVFPRQAELFFSP